jgi:hypothetical protein
MFLGLPRRVRRLRRKHKTLGRSRRILRPTAHRDGDVGRRRYGCHVSWAGSVEASVSRQRAMVGILNSSKEVLVTLVSRWTVEDCRFCLESARRNTLILWLPLLF